MSPTIALQPLQVGSGSRPSTAAHPSTGRGVTLSVFKGPGEPVRDSITGPGSFTVRGATAADAETIHALVTAYRGEGHLLTRSLDEIRAHAHRCAVAATAGTVIGCADLAPLGRTVAEIRSLVVAAAARRARSDGHRRRR